MLDFRKATIEDKEKVDEQLNAYSCPTLEYNFTTLFLWQDPYNIEFDIKDNVLFICSGKNQKSFLFPCGQGDIDNALYVLVEYTKQKGHLLNFYSVTEKQKEILERKFPDRFTFDENRDSSDYVYTSESLMHLKGKKLSSKRNHINRFISNYPDWKYENIDADNIDEVRKMHEKWCSLSDYEQKVGLDDEELVVKKAFDNFEKLNLKGGLIRANEKVMAFSLGDRLNDKTFLVHIEKAFNKINGAYTIINREFVAHNCMDYEFVNREDDTGDEGLRKAKMSYRPYEITKKYIAKEM